MKMCGYCGKQVPHTQREHVIPSCLYSPAIDPRIQRLTINSCPECNKSWQDDEVHFRNCLTFVAQNKLGKEVWETASRSFGKSDGTRRMLDLAGQIKRFKSLGNEARLTLPKDERFMTVVRKIIRGLCHYHKLLPYVTDSRVWAILLREEQTDFLETETLHHRDEKLVKWKFKVFDFRDVHSVWMLTLFETVTVVALVSALEDGFKYSGFASVLMRKHPPLRCRSRYRRKSRSAAPKDDSRN